MAKGEEIGTTPSHAMPIETVGSYHTLSLWSTGYGTSFTFKLLFGVSLYPIFAIFCVLGDGSASTFWDNRKWQSYFSYEACKDQGPPYVVADVIHTVLPNSKILVIMRNPTER